jgi:hypothetical protein
MARYLALCNLRSLLNSDQLIERIAIRTRESFKTVGILGPRHDTPPKEAVVKGRICQFRNPRNLGERELLDARYPRENLIPAAAWAARFRVADLVLSAKDLSFAMLAQFTAGSLRASTRETCPRGSGSVVLNRALQRVDGDTVSAQMLIGVGRSAARRDITTRLPVAFENRRDVDEFYRHS